MPVKEMHQSISLEKGRFRPAEARDILQGLSKERINSNKIQMLGAWERNHRCDTSQWDKKIERIQAGVEYAQDLIDEAQSKGFHVEINCNIEIKLVKPMAPSIISEGQEN